VSFYVVEVRDSMTGVVTHTFHGKLSNRVMLTDTGESRCLASEDEPLPLTYSPTPPEQLIRDAVSCAVFEADLLKTLDCDSDAVKLTKHRLGKEWDTANAYTKQREVKHSQFLLDLVNAALAPDETRQESEGGE
jgi:hypothetical protein